MHIYICMYACVYIYIYIYICTHDIWVDFLCLIESSVFRRVAILVDWLCLTNSNFVVQVNAYLHSCGGRAPWRRRKQILNCSKSICISSQSLKTCLMFPKSLVDWLHLTERRFVAWVNAYLHSCGGRAPWRRRKNVLVDLLYLSWVIIYSWVCLVYVFEFV